MIARSSTACTCRCTCGKGKNAASNIDSPLYKGRFRKALLTTLILVGLANFAMLMVAAVAVPATLSATHTYAWIGNGRSYNLSEAQESSIVFFWLTIPLIATTNSAIEIWQRSFKTLTLRRVFISSSICLVLWIIATGYWMPCILTTAWNYTSAASYCPFPGTGFSDWYFGFVYLGAEPALVPVFMIAIMIFHFVHITLSGFAFRRERKAQILQDEQNVDVESSGYYEKRYKITSSLYTDADFSSHHGASTLRSHQESLGPESDPPSYRGNSSSEPSLRDSESCSVSSMVITEIGRAHVREF